jgi:hypothetical protein
MPPGGGGDVTGLPQVATHCLAGPFSGGVLLADGGASLFPVIAC